MSTFDKNMLPTYYVFMMPTFDMLTYLKGIGRGGGAESKMYFHAIESGMIWLQYRFVPH